MLSVPRDSNPTTDDDDSDEYTSNVKRPSQPVIRVIKSQEQQKKELYELRKNWRIGDQLQYYAPRDRRWFLADIIEIGNASVHASEAEYFKVMYKNEYGDSDIVRVNRYDRRIRPLKLAEPRKSVHLKINTSPVFRKKDVQNKMNILYLYQPIDLRVDLNDTGVNII